ncbi:MAG: IS1595 family transposase [Gammaproteobacteria bacterium]|nr:IS1595 family transposase [Gammaproteobacteria bacterium]
MTDRYDLVRMNQTKHKGPGRHKRVGLTILEFMELFPDEETAELWFENAIWGETGRVCGHCHGVDTFATKSGKPMKYRCRACRKYFNIKTGTFLHGTQVPLRTWAHAIYLMVTNIKGISSLRARRELGVTPKTAWHMNHRVRRAMNIFPKEEFLFNGEVEVDETYIGGRESNRHASKKLHLGRGTVGKQPVIGVRDRETGLVRAEVIPDTTRSTLHGFIQQNVSIKSQVYTDEAHAYKQLVDYEHGSVQHSAGEYVKGKASTNGIESFWAMVKRGYIGTYHNMSFKHLHRYIREFSGRHNIRKFDTIVQIFMIIRNMGGTRLRYQDLIKTPTKKTAQAPSTTKV